MWRNVCNRLSITVKKSWTKMSMLKFLKNCSRIFFLRSSINDVWPHRVKSQVDFANFGSQRIEFRLSFLFTGEIEIIILSSFFNIYFFVVFFFVKTMYSQFIPSKSISVNFQFLHNTEFILLKSTSLNKFLRMASPSHTVTWSQRQKKLTNLLFPLSPHVLIIQASHLPQFLRRSLYGEGRWLHFLRAISMPLKRNF